MPGGSMCLFLEDGALDIILFKNKRAAEAEYIGIGTTYLQ